MEAATYVRLSASRLGEEAPGLDRQRRDVERLCRERGWDIDPSRKFHDADTSAFRDVDRPGFAALRAAVEDREVGAVVVWKMDRAFRRLREAVEFLDVCQAAGVVFASQQEGIDTSTPWGPVLYSLFASLAQMESQTRSDRTRAWHAERAEAGLPSGGGDRPYGFKADRVAHDRKEATALRSAAGRILKGGSLRSDARRLGLTTTGLKRALTAPRTVGLRQHGDKTYPAVWKPILDEDTWLALRELLDRPGHGAGRRYLLTGGLVVCGLCGGRLVARPKADGRRCYVCPPDGGCGKIRVLSAPLEELVAGAVAEREATHPREPEPAVTAAADLERVLAADESSLEELARDRYVTRSITEPEFRAARDDLVTRIADAQERLEIARRPRPTFRRALAPAPWEVEVGTDPDPAELEGWRRWVADYVERVVVNPAVKGRNFFTPDRVDISWR